MLHRQTTEYSATQFKLRHTISISPFFAEDHASSQPLRYSRDLRLGWPAHLKHFNKALKWIGWYETDLPGPVDAIVQSLTCKSRSLLQGGESAENQIENLGHISYIIISHIRSLLCEFWQKLTKTSPEGDLPWCWNSPCSPAPPLANEVLQKKVSKTWNQHCS